MKSKDALRVLTEVTAHQWGMVTSAQAGMHGATRLDLSRLTNSGHLERLAHGVYKVSGSPVDQFDDLYAAWLSTNPKVMGENRLKNRSHEVVIAGSSAARLHDIGDLWSDRHEFVSPRRRQSQRSEVRYRQRTLDPRDVTFAHGLPTMTVERTIVDLVEEVGDLSLVADALRDAAIKRNLDFDRLRDLLAPLAERNGFRRSDGEALLNRLLGIAGIDADTVARRVAADSSLGVRVAANYLRNREGADQDQLAMTPEEQKSLRIIRESITEMLERTLGHSFALDANTEESTIDLAKSVILNDIAKSLAEELTGSEAIKRLTEARVKSLGASSGVKAEVFAAIQMAERVTNDRT